MHLFYEQKSCPPGKLPEPPLNVRDYTSSGCARESVRTYVRTVATQLQLRL